MTLLVEDLYNQAKTKNPTYTKLILAGWMKGAISTEEFKGMLSQIVEGKE